MEILEKLVNSAVELIPSTAAVVVTVVLAVIARFLLTSRETGGRKNHFRAQVAMLLISFFGLLVVILTLPVSEGTVGQLLSLFGLLLSAAIALSATTFVGNIMGGLMLRAVRNFRSGDFVRVGEHFGRVSERGLFHIEIQTEDRDLTTLPNLYLVTNPVRVVRASGTLVTTEVSLGYDIPRDTVETALLAAIDDAGLGDGFVHMVELGDFAVTYRAAGLLTEVKSLLSTRSLLLKKMLDRLHAAGIEIVSPTFMNQRPLEKNQRFIPPVSSKSVAPPDELPEAVIFDKADEAESLENMRERIDGMQAEIKEIKEKAALDPIEKEDLERDLDRRQKQIDRLAELIARREEQSKERDK